MTLLKRQNYSEGDRSVVAGVGVGRRCDPCRKSMKFFGVRKAFISTGGSGYMNLYMC